MAWTQPAAAVATTASRSQRLGGEGSGEASGWCPRVGGSGRVAAACGRPPWPLRPGPPGQPRAPLPSCGRALRHPLLRRGRTTPSSVRPSPRSTERAIHALRQTGRLTHRPPRPRVPGSPSAPLATRPCPWADERACPPILSRQPPPPASLSGSLRLRAPAKGRLGSHPAGPKAPRNYQVIPPFLQGGSAGDPSSPSPAPKTSAWKLEEPLALRNQERPAVLARGRRDPPRTPGGAPGQPGRAACRGSWAAASLGPTHHPKATRPRALHPTLRAHTATGSCFIAFACPGHLTGPRHSNLRCRAQVGARGEGAGPSG